MAEVAVNREVLQWVLDRSGLTSKKLENKFPKIPAWLKGESQPSLPQLEKLAHAVHAPLGYMFLQKPLHETLPIPHFRTVADEAPNKFTPDLLETVQMMQRRQAWLRDWIVDQGQDKQPFVKSAELKETPLVVAGRIRKVLGFNLDWASHEGTWTAALDVLRNAMETIGILVVTNGIVGNNTHRKLDPNEFRGFVLVDDFAPLVFVNGTDGKAAQMFTLAHELAHIFYGSSAAFDLREMQPANDPTEQACNRVAAEFLVPESEIRSLWLSVRGNEEPFQDLAKKFKVSSIVAARRALDLNLISKTKFFEFYEEYQKDERRKKDNAPGGGDFYANQNFRIGRTFAYAVVRAVREGKLLYSEAYHLTGLYGKAFGKYADSIKIGGA